MSECQVCGEKRKDRLVAHPEYPADKLCVVCRIDWHEEEIESHEVDLHALYQKQAEFDKKDKAAMVKTLDGRKLSRKER
jgi:hypothetical protein